METEVSQSTSRLTKRTRGNTVYYYNSFFHTIFGRDFTRGKYDPGYDSKLKRNRSIHHVVLRQYKLEGGVSRGHYLKQQQYTYTKHGLWNKMSRKNTWNTSTTCLFCYHDVVVVILRKTQYSINSLQLLLNFILNNEPSLSITRKLQFS